VGIANTYWLTYLVLPSIAFPLERCGVTGDAKLVEGASAGKYAIGCPCGSYIDQSE